MFLNFLQNSSQSKSIAAGRGLFGRVKDAIANKVAPALDKVNDALNAGYENAQRYGKPEDRKAWWLADDMGADAQLIPAVRQEIRMRARYEFTNNSYCNGLMHTLGNDVVGTGPRLQLGGIDKTVAQAVIDRWNEWVDDTKFVPNLWSLYTDGNAVAGEGVMLFIDNKNAVRENKFDTRLVDCNRLGNPKASALLSPSEADGIKYDRYDNPIQYSIMRVGPGDVRFGIDQFAVDEYKPDVVVHLFKRVRAGQHRGVSYLAPCVHLFNNLRRYTEAVLGSAEIAADFAGILYTDSLPEDPNSVPTLASFKEVEIVRRMLMTLPRGWKLEQFKAEQPTTAFKEFKNEVLKEAARCLHIPFNVAAGDSSGYNYSSGRLDHQTYGKFINVERKMLEREVLARVFARWLEYALAIEGYIPKLGKKFKVRWFWDASEHVDPLLEAEAAQTLVDAGLLTYQEFWASKGHDWKERFDQIAIEQEYVKSKGIEFPKDAGSAPKTGDTGTTSSSGTPKSRPAKTKAVKASRRRTHAKAA